MSDNVPISFSEVLSNRLQSSLFINRESGEKSAPTLGFKVLPLNNCRPLSSSRPQSSIQDTTYTLAMTVNRNKGHITNITHTYSSSLVAWGVSPDMRYFRLILPRWVTSTFTPRKAFLICPFNMHIIQDGS